MRGAQTNGTTGDEPYYGSEATLVQTTSATFQVGVTAMPPINGSCGSAHGNTPLVNAPTSNLCTAGSPNGAVGAAGEWTWLCIGSNNGTTASCKAPMRFAVSSFAGPNGSISPSTSQTVAFQATRSFTVTPDAGYVIALVSGCGGQLQGNTCTTGPISSGCTVNASFTAAPIAGQCGTAHGGSTLQANSPGANLCSAGNSTSPVGGTNQWTWGCTGLHGGGSAQCLAPRGYTIGGSVSGLGTGETFVLKNGSETLSRSANGGFVFTSLMAFGGGYAVSVETQPTGQICNVVNASGQAAANVGNVQVNREARTYSIGGSLSGLDAGKTVELRNGTEILSGNANGSFTFTEPVTHGGSYQVSAQTQPEG